MKCKCVPLWCQIGINGMAAQHCFKLLEGRIHLRHPENIYILPIIFFILFVCLSKKRAFQAFLWDLETLTVSLHLQLSFVQLCHRVVNCR